MEKYYLQTVSSPVIDDTGQQIARVGDVILNTETGKVVGFLVGPAKKKAVATIDISTWNQALRVHDVHDLIDLDEVQQIAHALEKEIPVYKNKVVTKNGEYIGKVIDFGMDNKFFKLTCLIIAKSFLGLIFWDKRIIAAQDIIKMEKKQITVKNLVKPVKMKKLRVKMATSNL